jgi:hypothetical protein
MKVKLPDEMTLYDRIKAVAEDRKTNPLKRNVIQNLKLTEMNSRMKKVS